MKNTILATCALVLFGIGTANLVLVYGHRPRPDATPLEVGRIPPESIRRIADDYRDGYRVSDYQLSRLSAWVEGNPAARNAWCERERGAR